MDAERYLRRIGHRGSVEVGSESLAALQREHLLAVPFDALDCLLGNPVSVEPADAYRKVVEAQRGGFCFELNGLFAWLLGQLGFSVSMLAARPLRGDGELAPPFAHLTLLVELERRWLVDVGFGFPFALEPLDLDARSEQERGGRRFTISEDAGSLLAQELGGERPNGYVFSPAPVTIDAFREICNVFSTSPDSGFVRRGPVLQLHEDGWIELTRERLSGERGGERIEQELAGEAEWRQALEENFGLRVEGSTVSRAG